MTHRLSKFHTRFLKVFEHIDRHLDETLNVEDMSRIAAISKYHFHRLFSEMYGIGVYRYIQLCRLKKASYLLAFREDTQIIEVALASGFEAAESFSRAFRKGTGQSPRQFRKNPQWSPWNDTRQQLAEIRRQNMAAVDMSQSIEIVNFNRTRLAVLEHHGDPQTIGDSIRKFIQWRKQNDLAPSKNATFNILHNNPCEVAPGDYSLDIGVETDMDLTGNDAGLVEKIIPAGRCARSRFVGSDDALGEAIHFLYAEWLPQSGEEPRDFPLFVQRVKFYPDVAENEAVTDIYLALA
ncbi:MAG: AraC family transcriptional regulator [Gammaproteobacteria bacterium]|nr:AraC family transcriptional regulator [Gammaproteobacteria bacterium]